MERVFAHHVDELQELRQESEQLQLSFAPQTSGTLVLRLQEEVRLLDLTIHAEDDSEICVFLDIRCAHELKLTQQVHAGRDAQVKIGILDLEEEPQTMTCTQSLTDPGRGWRSILPRWSAQIRNGAWRSCTRIRILMDIWRTSAS